MINRHIGSVLAGTLPPPPHYVYVRCIQVSSVLFITSSRRDEVSIFSLVDRVELCIHAYYCWFLLTVLYGLPLVGVYICIYILFFIAIFILQSDNVSPMFQSVIKEKSGDTAARRRHSNAHRQPLPKCCAPLHWAGGVSRKSSYYYH